MIVLPTKNVGKGKFDLRGYEVFRNVGELGVIEAQMKEDGAINDAPSLLLVMKDEATNVYATQFTLETLQAMLSKFGYVVRKKNSDNKGT